MMNTLVPRFASSSGKHSSNKRYFTSSVPVSCSSSLPSTFIPFGATHSQDRARNGNAAAFISVTLDTLSLAGLSATWLSNGGDRGGGSCWEDVVREFGSGRAAHIANLKGSWEYKV